MSYETTIDENELKRFEKLASEWWNPKGKCKALHELNPTRLSIIRDETIRYFNRDPHSQRPLEGLGILDIGCGGGLMSEPMTRLGGQVLGADPVAENIIVAKLHAHQSQLDIDYRVTTAEELAESDKKFDVILNMEVIEHVRNPEIFISNTAKILNPEGIMFVSTINRTQKAFALAIVLAEYVLGWLPKGTHEYDKFITPEELKKMLQKEGLQIIKETGMTWNPLLGVWKKTENMRVNYMIAAGRPKNQKKDFRIKDNQPLKTKSISQKNKNKL